MHKWASLAVVVLALASAGCELTASAYVEKQWVTDPHLYTKPDAVSKLELKVTKLVGRDAKLAELKKAKQ